MPLFLLVGGLGQAWLSGVDGVDRLGSPWVLAAIDGGTIAVALAVGLFVIPREDVPVPVLLATWWFAGFFMGMTLMALLLALIIFLQGRVGYGCVEAAAGIVGLLVAAGISGSIED